jgi:hypothetical protein
MALERAEEGIGKPFAFGAARRKTPHYPSDTARQMMGLLDLEGSLSRETRPNANGVETDYWTAERFPLFPSNWGWHRECAAAEEAKLEPMECPDGLLVRGITAQREEPGFENLSGPFPTGG